MEEKILLRTENNKLFSYIALFVSLLAIVAVVCLLVYSEVFANKIELMRKTKEHHQILRSASAKDQAAFIQKSVKLLQTKAICVIMTLGSSPLRTNCGVKPSDAAYSKSALIDKIRRIKGVEKIENQFCKDHFRIGNG